MKRLDTKMQHNKSLTMKVVLGWVVAGCFLPLQVRAQPVTDIQSYITCVNNLAAAGVTVVDTVKACVPNSGCYYTNTLSEESPQAACTLRDGTRLPRVIFSCQGPAVNLQFRPSYSLCPLGGISNHTEIGEDTPFILDHQRVQKMGDITLPLPPPLTFPLGAATVLDTSTNSQGCADCHDKLGAVGGVNLFAPVRPELAEGTISSNDPTVQKPVSPVSLSTICSGIANSSQLANNPTRKQQALDLCYALLAKEH
jgi:hypothetical protein